MRKIFIFFSPVIYLDNQDAVEEDEDADQKMSKRRGLEIITFTEEQTAELAKDPGEEASVSERILAQSAAERDRISEIKDRAVELETEPKFANCCNFCPKSFKKPSDLVRYRKNKKAPVGIPLWDSDCPCTPCKKQLLCGQNTNNRFPLSVFGLACKICTFNGSS